MNESSQIRKRFLWSGLILASIILIGSLGYWFIGGRQHSLLDTLYMTFITITTIGFGEIIDFSNNPGGRLFTIFIAISGIGMLLYVVTNLTAMIVEGDLTQTFRRRRMEKLAGNSIDHDIVCGLGSVGFHIASELDSTKRPYVIVDINADSASRYLEALNNGIFIEGDATDDTTLLKAGIEGAKGLFAVTGDDNNNLVISLTARQLSPKLRIIVRCNEIANSEKMMRVGADAVVSPAFIGGLRMASEMIRPTVVSFLDTMLRDKEKNLRIEEISVPKRLAGKTLSDLDMKKQTNTLLLAVRTKKDWLYNPPDSYIIKPENVLVVMTTPEGRNELERFFIE
ncbi:MAG: potassium channel protein [Dehalococcoidales bacterium]|nr:potassium channel protein [Dehalococcoidales bacterium]